MGSWGLRENVETLVLSLIRRRARDHQNATGSHTALHGIIQGLKPGLHGLHIHTYGDLSSGCKVLGTHYNPLNRRHNDNVNIDRHAGDLGNIQAAANGVAEFFSANCEIPLRGANSILGRSIVVHDHADDLGRSGSISGNAGGPVACGIIGVRYHA
ncbi:superoxide dismutase [Cu-Zn] 4AP [Selaginella moellendorffii]|uniref:superoxide dismutase [Cu-Zn] 4AP n=1 Tax=Selaginella moellendorffii TaxID=88036 RepID=UPI000D1CC850|nr:superoxide dismutase [Cu-Zn] 4AP [Selaginella moellendorffii]|eukprot:XP_024516522.1 superoxide dismutase [Cu-Zn] 4AP [Selaginella moellendorffii]